MYRRRSPRRGDCPLALCCMAFGLGVPEVRDRKERPRAKPVTGAKS